MECRAPKNSGNRCIFIYRTTPRLVSIDDKESEREMEIGSEDFSILLERCHSRTRWLGFRRDDRKNGRLYGPGIPLGHAVIYVLSRST
jgi:hypothetical protein